MSNKKLYPVYGLVRAIVNAYYAFLVKIKPKSIPRLYVFTDSRGFRVDLWYCKKNPCFSYISRLSKKYRVDYSLCQYQHTTLIDFLYDIRDVDLSEYDKIILHVGVVDFSPRPMSQAVSIIQKKADRIEALFGKEALKDFSPRAYEEEYNGQKTASLYDLNVLTRYIVPALNKISHKLVWIGVSPVLNDWQGNYDRARPVNLNNVIKEYQDSVNGNFKGVIINFLGWGGDAIKSLTIDNIHFSEQGFFYLYNEIEAVMGSDV